MTLHCGMETDSPAGRKADWEALVDAAWKARESAYAPYSRFQVGAAVLTDSGRIYTGVNVENVSYGLTLCAERCAVACAVAAGERGLQRLVVVADTAEPVSPCGACRQVLAEFNQDMEILLVNREGTEALFRLGELLPRPKTGIPQARDVVTPPADSRG